MPLQLSGSTSTTVKLFAIGLIVLVLLIPLSMLQSLVRERVGLREQAYQKVAEGWGGKLVAGGPMLIVPTERKVLENNVVKLYREDLYVLPAQLNVDVDLKNEPQPRHVGIYAVPVYLANLKLTGVFDFRTALQDLDARYPVFIGSRRACAFRCRKCEVCASSTKRVSATRT
jgi:inner membrane protein